MSRMMRIAMVTLALVGSNAAEAAITFSPYVSVRSTKTIMPQKSKKTGTATEKETVKQHREAGLNAGIGFWRLMRFQVGVGQSKVTATEKISEIKDEYGKIDIKSELNIPENSDPAAEVTTTETQRVARASLIVDPSFWIFILRAKVGATAKQRIFEKQTPQGSELTQFKPIYGLHSGVGAGIRFSAQFFAVAEYSFEHYAFPTELEPFERQLSVSFNVTL